MGDNTSCVAISNDKLAATVRQGCGVPNDLVHQTREAVGVVIGTSSSHDQVRKCDMALVIIAVNVVASFPARGKHDLEAQAILTVGIEIVLVRHVVAVESALGVLVVVQTVEAKRALSQCVLVGLAEGFPFRLARVRLARVACRVGSPGIVSRQHSEIGRKSGDVVAVEKVVAAGCQGLSPIGWV